MKAELIDCLGDDLRVVNSARVSFDKNSEWDINFVPGEDENGTYEEAVKSLSTKDQKLINYLAKHNHWTPFSHVMITMRETVPIFVARQRFKSSVGFTYNEVSRRYVDDEPKFFFADAWRGKPINAKQGSSEVIFGGEEEVALDNMYLELLSICRDTYNEMIRVGIAPEQARMVLPQSMMTNYYVTGSLAAWARAYNLRSEEHSQKEIQDLASQWNNIINNIDELKYSWAALTNR